MKRFGMLCALLAGALLAGHTQAQEAGQTYIGIGYGAVYTEGASPYNLFIRDEDTAASARIYGGKMWGTLGMELGYYNLGKYETVFTGTNRPMSESKASAIVVSGVAALPLAPGYQWHGKIGLAFTQFEVKCLDAPVCAGSSPVLIDGARKRGLSGVIGIGVSAKLTQDVAVRMDYEHFGNFHQTVGTQEYRDSYDTLLLSLQFHF